MNPEKSPTRAQLRVFVIAIVAAFSVIAISVLQRWMAFGTALAVVLVPGLLVVAVACLRPDWFETSYQRWRIVTYPIQWLLTIVVLAIVFVFLLVPIGCIRRILGGDVLSRKIDRSNKTKSYWNSCETIVDNQRFFRQY